MSVALFAPIGPRDHTVGPADAPATLVEYGDYECPHCGRAYPIVESVRRQLGGSLLFAYRHFPLTQIHPHAADAAEMAEVAGSQNHFWPMHQMLFTHQAALDPGHLVAYAEQVGMDPRWAATAFLAHTHASRVQEDFLSGVRSGVNGTPTFFINGARYDGSWDEPDLVDALEIAVHAVRRM
jgi:protein-disulfide isomerase